MKKSGKKARGKLKDLPVKKQAAKIKGGRITNKRGNAVPLQMP